MQLPHVTFFWGVTFGFPGHGGVASPAALFVFKKDADTYAKKLEADGHPGYVPVRCVVQGNICFATDGET